MLTSFGIFWGAEGTGVDWPGHDAALLGVIPAVAVVSMGYLALLRRLRPAPSAEPRPVPAASQDRPEGVTR